MPLVYSVLAVREASRGKRIAHSLAVLGVIAFSIFASLYSMVLTFPKVNVVTIQVQAQVTDKVNLVTTTIEARPDERGVVIFDLLGTSDLPSATRLGLRIYLAAVPDGFDQPWCCTVVKNTFYCKARLGSEH